MHTADLLSSEPAAAALKQIVLTGSKNSFTSALLPGECVMCTRFKIPGSLMQKRLPAAFKRKV